MKFLRRFDRSTLPTASTETDRQPSPFSPVEVPERIAEIAAALRDMDGCPGCDLDGPFCVRHGVSRVQLATRLLDELDLTPVRRAHSLGVAQRMRENLAATGLAHTRSSAWCDEMVTAALLHDIGYSELAIRAGGTGHHALNGAVLLQRLGLSERLVSLVAWHSTSEYEAVLRRRESGHWLYADLCALAPKPSSLEASLIWVCDFTTTPHGELTDPAQRVSEIRDRYEPDSPVVQALDASKLGLLHAFHEVERLVRGWEERQGPASEGTASEGTASEGTAAA